ncbi:hypothetical protein CGLAMM_01370 [Acetobacteraceae bacterium EV16G]
MSEELNTVAIVGAGYMGAGSRNLSPRPVWT